MSVTLLEISDDFPEVLFLDPSHSIDDSYIDFVLKKIQEDLKETTYGSTERVCRFNDKYLFVGSYGAVTTSIIKTLISKHLATKNLKLEIEQISSSHLLELGERLPKRNLRGEWHGGQTNDSHEIDEPILPLVNTLNALGVETFSSCAGHGIRTPYVLFRGNFDSISLVGKKITDTIKEFSVEERNQLGIVLLWAYGEWIQYTGLYFEIRFHIMCPESLLIKFSTFLDRVVNE